MRLLDIARSAYVSSPPGLRRSLAPVLAIVPTSMKYGGSYRAWRAAIARARSDFTYVEAERARALGDLLRSAHAGSPFHRERIEHAFGVGRDPGSIGPEELGKLPVLTKEELTRQGEAALAVPAAQLDAGNTSGSNGEAPFGFYLDRDRSVREIAFVHDVWSRCGYRPGDARAMLRDAYLYDEKGFIWEWEAALGELRFSVFPMTEADIDLYLDMMDGRSIRYLHGFPSAIEMMARHMIAKGHRLKKPLKGVFPISEPIYAHQRAAIADAFGDVAVLPFYGMSEKAIFAAEMAGEPGVYVCDPLYGIAELVDEDGQPVVEPGREGRLVGTSFITRGMPFIRYDSEDRAVLVEPASIENGYRLVVRDIAPRRKPAFLVDRDGRRVVSTDFTPTQPEFFDGMKEFQFYQETPGICIMRYVPTAGSTPEEAERIRAELQDKAGETITFRLERVDALTASKNGKRPFIEQHIDHA